MKVLFVNPYIHDFSAYDLWLRPLGLYYLAAAVRCRSKAEIYWLDALDRFQQGVKISGREDGRGKYLRTSIAKPEIFKKIPRRYSRYGIDLDLFLEKIASLPDIDVIAITSLMTYWLDGLQFTLRLLKERFPRARVVLGGLMPSLAPTVTKAHGLADVVVRGYGETALLKILADWGAKVADSPGFRSLDDLPFPALDLAGSQKHVPLLTARGCPCRCTYCASGLLNPDFLQRQPGSILREVFERRQKFNSEHFIIFDDALLADKDKRFQKVFSFLAEELPETVQFHAPNGLHVREIDANTAATLYAARFKTLRLSFESLAAGILRASEHKITRRQMEKAVDCLEQAGYRRAQMEVYLLFGYPGQTLAEMKAALAFVGKMGLVPHLALFSPVPGTIDFLRLQRQGVLAQPLELLESNKLYFLYEKSGFAAGEIQEIKEMATAISAASLNQSVPARNETFAP